MEINRIITKYLAGECDPLEKAILDDWLNEKPENLKEFQVLKEYWEEECNYIKESKVANWEKLQQSFNTQSSLNKTDNFQSSQVEFRYGNFLLKAAATLIFFVGVWLVFQQMNEEKGIDEPLTLTPIIIEKNIPLGRKSTIKLSDGSVIKMNSGSSIKFPEKFVGDTREIEIVGEAFLEVAKDENRPFIVKAGNLKTKVLGTAFNIKSMPKEHEVRIALVEGKVQVSDTNTKREMFLAPGEMITAKNTDFKKSKFDYETEIAWKDGLLVFKNAPPEVIFYKLEKWYGLKIITNKKISRQGYTSTFSNESLEEVLNIISESKNFEFKINKEEEKVIIW